jgi:hypothetical protein
VPDPVPGSWRGVVNRYNQSPAEVQAYFESLPSLIESYQWEVSLGFLFIRVEKALNTMLYCGARKVRRANAEVARKFVDAHHMTRKEFRRLFANVFGRDVPSEITAILAEAEKVRDKVIHGKMVSDADFRKATVRVIEYAEAMNELVHEIAAFKPFTIDLRGFVGRGEALDRSTTMWLMKGLGFLAKQPGEAEA